MGDVSPLIRIVPDGDRLQVWYGQAVVFVRLADLPALVDRLGEHLPELMCVGPLSEARPA